MKLRPNFSESDIAELRERCGEFAEDWIKAVEQRDRLAAKAYALVRRVRLIHEDPEYRAVWESAQLHRGPYRGLKYGYELDSLEGELPL